MIFWIVINSSPMIIKLLLIPRYINSAIMESMDGVSEEKFDRERHIKYFIRCINILPNAYVSMDTSR